MTTNPDPTNDEKDIVTLAVSTDFLSTLVAAVQAGDLVGVLQGDGPFTVFAPTNEAFALYTCIILKQITSALDTS